VNSVNLPWGGGHVTGPAMVPAMALEAALSFGALIGMMFAVTAGLTSELRDERTLPNEGIRRSARHAMAIWLAAALIIGLAAARFLEGWPARWPAV
jgi:hypothetical protein